MSTGSNYGGTSVASRPIIAPGAAVQTYFPVTYASSAYDDLAPSLYPQGAKVLRSLHGALRKSDRASFAVSPPLERSKLSQALIDIALLLVICVLLSSVASAIGCFAYAAHQRVIS